MELPTAPPPSALLLPAGRAALTVMKRSITLLPWPPPHCFLFILPPRCLAPSSCCDLAPLPLRSLLSALLWEKLQTLTSSLNTSEGTSQLLHRSVIIWCFLTMKHVIAAETNTEHLG